MTLEIQVRLYDGDECVWDFSAPVPSDDPRDIAEALALALTVASEEHETP